MKKILKWVVIAIVALVVIAAISSGGDKNSTTSSSSTEQDKPAVLSNIGVASDVKFAVSGMKSAKSVGSNPYAKAKASGIFKVVTISVTNNQKDAITMDGSLFKLIDDKEREFNVSNEAITALMTDDKDPLFLKEINPGITVKGTVVFDVPKDAKGFKLVAQGGMTGDDVELKVK